MADFKKFKAKIRAEGTWIVGSDPIAPGTTRIFMILDPRKDLDREALAEKMKGAGIYSKPVKANPKHPNVYSFIGQASDVEIATDTGTKLLETNPISVEEHVPVAFFAASTFSVASGFNDEIIQEIRDIEESRKTVGAEIIPMDTEVGLDTWVFLRIIPKAGSRAPSSAIVRDRLIAAGHKALAFDQGLQGLIVASEDWHSKDWVEVMFNPGEETVTARQLKVEVFGPELFGDSGSLGLYTNEYLREHQGAIEGFYQAQKAEIAVSGAAGALGLAIQDLLGLVEGTAKTVKYIAWGAVGLLAVYAGTKAYKLMKNA